jgi:hypothetical protein
MQTIDRFLCWITAHRWTRSFCVQLPTHRVVSRYCTRCDATSHVLQDVWDEPTRALVRELDALVRGGAA